MSVNELIKHVVKEIVDDFKPKERLAFTDLKALLQVLDATEATENELTAEAEKKLLMELKSQKHIIIFEPTKIKLKRSLEAFLLDFPELLTNQEELVYTIVFYKRGRTQFYGFVTKPLRLNLTKKDKEKVHIGVLKLIDNDFKNTVYSYEDYQNLLLEAEKGKMRENASKIFTRNVNNPLMMAAVEEMSDKEFLDKMHQHPDIYGAFKDILANQDFVTGDLRIISYDVVDYIQTGSEGSIAIEPLYSNRYYLNTILDRETILRLLPTTLLYTTYSEFIYSNKYQHFSIGDIIYTIYDGINFLENIITELEEALD